MKILYAAMKHDLGDKSLGLSNEHICFYQTFKQLGHDIIYFDFLTLFNTKGKEYLNNRLLKLVKKQKPDLLFLFPYQEEFDWQVINQISTSTQTLTFAWFDNCVWRYNNYYKHIAPFFNWVGTTESRYVDKYKNLGVDQVSHVQWGISPRHYQKLNLTKKFHTSFVGRAHGTRKKRLQQLNQLAISVNKWGVGWPRGKLTLRQMVRVFNQSKINLNYTETSHQGKEPFASLRYRELIPPLTQMKARLFEIPGTGSFMLTQSTHDLPLYYKNGREIVTFTDTDDAAEKITFYLSHDTLREKIAARGYARTLKDHTYETRFKKLFRLMRLK